MLRIPARLGAVAAAALVVTALAGCQGTTSPAPTAVRSTDLTSSDGGFDAHAVIGVVLDAPSTSSSLRSPLAGALDDAGFRAEVRVASASDRAASQRRAVHTLIRTGAKAVLVDAARPSALRSEVQFAHDAGAVVVALGDRLPGTRTEESEGIVADYRVDGASADELVSRSVDLVRSLQRGEKPSGDGVTAG